MTTWLSRQVLALGEENTKKIKSSTVMVLGLGGVGGAAAEALARVGVGRLVLVDNDVFEPSNINRQTFATTRTIGKKKTKVVKKYLEEINPEIECIVKDVFYLPEKEDYLFKDIENIDYIVDAIDTITAKLGLVVAAKKKNIPIISSMGMGNRICPSKIRIDDIFETSGSGCGVSKVMRRELRKRDIKKLKVVYSTEPPIQAVVTDSVSGRHSPGSTALVPPVAGYFLAAEVVAYIIDTTKLIR